MPRSNSDSASLRASSISLNKSSAGLWPPALEYAPATRLISPPERAMAEVPLAAADPVPPASRNASRATRRQPRPKRARSPPASSHRTHTACRKHNGRACRLLIPSVDDPRDKPARLIRTTRLPSVGDQRRKAWMRRQLEAAFTYRIGRFAHYSVPAGSVASTGTPRNSCTSSGLLK